MQSSGRQCNDLYCSAKAARFEPMQQEASNNNQKSK